MYYLKVATWQIDLSINKRHIVYIHTLKTTSIKIIDSALIICWISCKDGLKQKADGAFASQINFGSQHRL